MENIFIYPFFHYKVARKNCLMKEGFMLSVIVETRYFFWQKAFSRLSQI
ncbi:hypothetical protein DU19_0551 [Chlamydia muridarum]|nr:hypothetical protein DU17_0553 [Chlamydia muridarum]KDU81508.1 hypothetical protein DU18_0553 [Chlamydia muridarum]KDU82518.1 hypothetical protein DU19_0551 [Chlamydia muridarum]KDU83460.1 hypothetical protein DU20_0551 [Chlamydia muridarum]KDU84682.1 hypothetical protein DU21_0553 [Chlamydia muridarum]